MVVVIWREYNFNYHLNNSQNSNMLIMQTLVYYKRWITVNWSVNLWGNRLYIHKFYKHNYCQYMSYYMLWWHDPPGYWFCNGLVTVSHIMDREISRWITHWQVPYKQLLTCYIIWTVVINLIPDPLKSSWHSIKFKAFVSGCKFNQVHAYCIIQHLQSFILCTYPSPHVYNKL